MYTVVHLVRHEGGPAPVKLRFRLLNYLMEGVHLKPQSFKLCRLWAKDSAQAVFFLSFSCRQQGVSTQGFEVRHWGGGGGFEVKAVVDGHEGKDNDVRATWLQRPRPQGRYLELPETPTVSTATSGRAKALMTQILNFDNARPLLPETKNCRT